MFPDVNQAFYVWNGVIQQLLHTSTMPMKDILDNADLALGRFRANFEDKQNASVE